MGSGYPQEEAFSEARAVFATTHWSVVLAARDGSLSTTGTALETLCRTYWSPVYAFIRRDGHSPEDAEDLTQEFFRKLLERKYLRHLVHQEGKFRSFLLKFAQHFLSDERDRVRAQKRGGGREIISFDALTPEERARLEPSDALTPERAFEQQYVHSLVRQAQVKLRSEYVAGGKEALYEILKGIEPGERGARSYAEIAAHLHTTETAIKVAVHRLRQRHRELLRAEIAQTVATPIELEQETQYLASVLGR